MLYYLRYCRHAATPDTCPRKIYSPPAAAAIRPCAECPERLYAETKSTPPGWHCTAPGIGKGLCPRPPGIQCDGCPNLQT